MSEEAKDEGGPAFPVPETDQNYYQSGMTLRDYFAAAALTGLHAGCEGAFSAAHMAEMAYAQADAMITERYKR